MKQLTFILLLTSFACFAQKKQDTIVSDTARIEIPERQLQKLAEINKIRQELQAREEDILLDLLAPKANQEAIKGKRYLGIIGGKMVFVKQ